MTFKEPEHIERFAYGDDTMNTYPCPAVAAGFSPASGDVITKVAEQYDEILRDSRSDEGTVEESEAKEAWFEAITYFQRTVEQAQTEAEREHYQELVTIGDEIADELGWLADDAEPRYL